METAAAGDLFLCRNVLIEEPINLKQISALKSKPVNRFRPGDRITAVYMLPMTGKEKRIEFKWMRHLGPSGMMQHDRYVHAVNHDVPGETYIAYAWMMVDPSFFDGILGSKYSGDWSLDVFVDEKKTDEISFALTRD